MLEKDIHVTDALRVLSNLAHEHVRFVFCGGTSLSKAYFLIERMSEDVDLKIVLHEHHGLSNAQLRAHLSALKSVIEAALSAAGFQELTDQRRAQTKTNILQVAGAMPPFTRTTQFCDHF